MPSPDFRRPALRAADSVFRLIKCRLFVARAMRLHDGRVGLVIIARQTGVRKRPFRARFPVSPGWWPCCLSRAGRCGTLRRRSRECRRPASLASDQCIGNDNSGAHSIAVVCIRMEWDSMEW